MLVVRGGISTGTAVSALPFLNLCSVFIIVTGHDKTRGHASRMEQIRSDLIHPLENYFIGQERSISAGSRKWNRARKPSTALLASRLNSPGVLNFSDRR